MVCVHRIGAAGRGVAGVVASAQVGGAGYFRIKSYCCFNSTLPFPFLTIKDCIYKRLSGNPNQQTRCRGEAVMATNISGRCPLAAGVER